MKPSTLVLAFAAILFLVKLGGHDLWAPDEPYFAEGAREMVVDGEWLVPHVNGEVTTDKPPLFFWTIALFSLPFGQVTPWTARLPSALAALGTLFLMLRLGRRMGGERVACLTAFVLATTMMFWDKARWAQIDMLLCLLIWVALSAFEAWRAGTARGRPAGLLFAVATGLAVLAKGPVGVLLPLGVVVLTLALDRRLSDLRRFAPISGPLVFLLVAGSWAAATILFPQDYSVWGAFREHFVDRGIHGLHHRQPFYYYLAVLPNHLLPWSGLVPAALILAWRRRDSADRFLLANILFVVIFFSISTEKRHLYVLPAFPAFAMAIARLIEAVLRATVKRPEDQPVRGATTRLPGLPWLHPRWFYWGQTAVGGLLAVAGAALPFAARGRHEVPYAIAVALGLVFLSSGVLTIVACRRRTNVLAAAAVPALGFATAFLVATWFIFPALEPEKSSRPFSQKMKAATSASRAAGHAVVAYDLSNLPEAFAFYTDGLYTRTTEDVEVLAKHLEQQGEVWAVANRQGLDLLPPALRDRLVVVEETQLSRRDVVLVKNRE